MKKLLTILCTLAILLSIFTGCGASAKPTGELNLYTWESMFPQEVLDAFTKETGIKVNYSSFDFNETMFAKLEAAKGGDYDVVIADDYIIELIVKQGLAQKLDKSKLSNIGNVNPLYQGQFYDSNNEYTVPYGAGVQTIVYNPAVINTPITGYANLWDETFKDNVGIIANYRVVNGMALKVLGESYNTDDVQTIKNAGEKLLELAPNIRLIKDDNLQDDLISGEVAAAVMYTSQVTLAKLADPTLEVVYPSEGIGFGIMAQFIPANAPNADAAHQFINYILQPEVAAQCFEHLGFYCTNRAAEEFINEEYKSFLSLPDFINENNMEILHNVTAEADEAHTLVWTQFKNATGK